MFHPVIFSCFFFVFTPPFFVVFLVSVPSVFSCCPLLAFLVFSLVSLSPVLVSFFVLLQQETQEIVQQETQEVVQRKSVNYFLFFNTACHMPTTQPNRTGLHPPRKAMVASARPKAENAKRGRRWGASATVELTPKPMPATQL